MIINLIAFLTCGIVGIYFLLKWIANPGGKKLYKVAFFVLIPLSILNLTLYII